MNKKIISILMAMLVFTNASAMSVFADGKNTAISSKENALITKKQVISIVPLDSRPCNTQYPQLTGGIMNQAILLPPSDMLDNYTSPSDSESLWTWMQENAKLSDHMIIFTNQLFNGGLISSRSYVNSDSISYDVSRLEKFVLDNPELKVTVVSILPRLLPSQFDMYFKKYQKSLASWGKQLDLNYTMQKSEPTFPSDVPAEIAQRYRDLYTYHADLTTAISEMAEKDIIKNYYIGQDDGEQFAPSNIIYRSLLSGSHKNVIVQKGADELTMMICALENPTPHEINLVYTNPSLVNTYLPYESAPLNEIVKEKLSVLGITVNPEAKDTLIVHNDPLHPEQVAALIPDVKSGYIAVADVSYTNRGDANLKDLLFKKDSLSTIDAYSGWNTAANTIGTVLSQYIATEYLKLNYDKLEPSTVTESLDSLMKFKYVRLAEDIIYQGTMVNNMRTIFTARDMRMANGDLYSDRKYEAEQLLNEYAFKYVFELNQIFRGSNYIHLGERTVETKYNFVNSTFTYPWHRTFEVLVSTVFSK
ncbi:DUF4127 family protein [Proteocatella sphenisci]|uniref:DUF4127 family protein n=1 Tax=Proteocatella sphenisci TaxID=181070 RepID=UPI000490BE3E|nr:DUF4127 family protein [Proteocatella sphenisci]